MRALRTIALTLLALACMTPAAPAAEVLGLAPSVKVQGSRVTLLDLAAAPQDLSPALRERLAEITVGAAPALGRQTTIAGSRLRSYLNQANLGPGVSVLLPEEVQVERASQRLGAQQMAQLYIQTVNQRLGRRAGQADIHDVATGRDLVLPAGQLSTQVRLVGAQGGEIMGRVPAAIDVFVDGRKEAQARVTGQVDIYGQVLVAARPLMNHQVITAEDVEIRRVNLGEAGPGAVAEAEQVVGLRPRGAVAAGQVLDLRHLEPAPLIRRGDVVNMVCGAQGLKISAKGKAEQTGYINGRIRLTNLASKREVWGRVVDSGTVVVDF